MNEATSADDRNLAMLTHLSGILFSVIVPLIMWLVHKDKPEKHYLVAESKEALNFQVTVLIGWVISSVLTVILIGFLLMAVVWIANVILCILAAIQASKGESYRYPMTLRLIS
jgi:uncharacterized Tic20 family protein